MVLALFTRAVARTSSGATRQPSVDECAFLPRLLNRRTSVFTESRKTEWEEEKERKKKKKDERQTRRKEREVESEDEMEKREVKRCRKRFYEERKKEGKGDTSWANMLECSFGCVSVGGLPPDAFCKDVFESGRLQVDRRCNTGKQE